MSATLSLGVNPPGSKKVRVAHPSPPGRWVYPTKPGQRDCLQVCSCHGQRRKDCDVGMHQFDDAVKIESVSGGKQKIQSGQFIGDIGASIPNSIPNRLL